MTESSKEEEIDPKLNFDYLSFINEDIDTQRKKYEVKEETKLESIIPGIFISYEKINEYFMLMYNLNKCEGNNKHRIKYKEEKDEYKKIIKDYIDKETSIPNMYNNQKSLLEFLCYDLYLFIINLYSKAILNPSFDKNTNYKDLFSLITIIADIEFNIKENIQNNNFDIFYSLIYFLLSLKKEIFHILEIYSYISNKFREKKYLEKEKKEEKKEKKNFFDIFKENIEKKIALYTKQKKKQPLLSIYLCTETFFHILNNKSIEEQSIIVLFKNIVFEFLKLNETLNLNGREIYTFVELIKVNEILYNYNSDIKKNIFKLIIEASNFEISKHLNIDLNEQNCDKIMLLENNNEEIKDEESNTLYENLNKIYKSIYEIIKDIRDNEDKKKVYGLIIEIFVQELKKYNNNFYYFIILRNLLKENDGEAFEYSKDIFEIMLNKFLFQECPNKKTDIENFFKEIKYEEDNSFIKNYFYIVKNNKKLKVFLEEIIIQTFGFHLNGYFMKYTDKINDTISYKKLDKDICEKMFDTDNLEFLKKCITFLEKEIGNSGNFEEYIFASLFCCNFIQYYFYHLVKYIFDNRNEDLSELYDYSEIINIIDKNDEGEQTTPFRFSIKVLFMRLLYYNFGDRKDETYENFKKFDFAGRKITFREQFKGDKKFGNSIPKLIIYSRISLEDYKENETFKNIIGNGKEDEETTKKISKIFYNLANNSISLLSDASKKSDFIEDDERNEIDGEVEKLLAKDEPIYNFAYGALKYNYLSIMSGKIAEIFNYEKNKQTFDLIRLENQEDESKVNEKILGILLYSFRISFISLIQSEKEERKECEESEESEERKEYFYKEILKLKGDELLNFLKDSYVPGFDNNSFFNENFSNQGILALTLKFIFHSHLFFSYSQGHIEGDKIKNSSNKTYLQTLITIWNELEKKLKEEYINKIQIKIEIFLNLIIKYLPEYLKLYLKEDNKNSDKKEDFMREFQNFFEKCIKYYPEYQKYYIDYSMKYIIQEYNFPLRYKEDKYPFMKYLVINSKPNIINIKEKIRDSNSLLKAIYMNEDKEYKFDYLRNFKNYNLIVNNIIKLLSYSSYYEKIKENKIEDLNFIKEKKLLLDLIAKNAKNEKDEKNIQKIKETSISKLNEIILELYEKYKQHQNKILLMSNLYENNFKRTFRKMNIQNCLTDENINFELSDFSKHHFYNSIYAKFFSRASFDKNKNVDYFDYQKFDIDIKHLEEELFSILFYRKSIFDNTKIDTIIFRYDGLNKNKNIDNTQVIENFLMKYKQEKMDKELLEQFNDIIGRNDKNKYENKFNEQHEKKRKEIEENEKAIKEKEESKNNILNRIKELKDKDNEFPTKIDEFNKQLNDCNKKLGELNNKEQNEETKKQINEEQNKINDLNESIEKLNKEKEENKNKLNDLFKQKKQIFTELDKLNDKKNLSNLLYKKLNKSYEQLKKEYILSKEILEILLDMAFSIQSLFKYLIKYNLPNDIPLFFIYQNMPDNLFNSEYLKKIFSKMQNICIKHLYSLYEYLEIILLPFFLDQVNECYSNKISQYTIALLNKLLKDDEFKENINIKKNELIDPIRKFICRYLVSSDKSEVINGEENLILLLCNNEIWDYLNNDNNKFSEIKDSLININNLLVEPILVKNTLNLFDVLLNDKSISDNNKRSEAYLNLNQDPKNLVPLSYDIVKNKTKFSKNVETIIDFIMKPERIIEFKDLTSIKLTNTFDQSLYSLCKYEDNKIITVSRKKPIRVFSYDKNTFKKENEFKAIEITNLKNIKDTNHNCVKVLQDNTIILLCTKAKIIRLSIKNNVAKVIQTLEKSNYNCNQFYNAIEFDNDKLIASSDKNFIIWEKNSDNKYIDKENNNIISTNNDTNIVYVNSEIFAIYVVNNNIIKFYNKRFEEEGSQISNINSGIEPLIMTMLNEEILGVCGKGNAIIYLIDIKKRNIVKQVKFNDFEKDCLSIAKLIDSTIIINNSNGSCLHAKLIKSGENYDMELIGKLNDSSQTFYTFEYLYDEIFIRSSIQGDIYAYVDEKLKDIYDDNKDSNNNDQISNEREEEESDDDDNNSDDNDGDDEVD